MVKTLQFPKALTGAALSVAAACGGGGGSTGASGVPLDSGMTSNDAGDGVDVSQGADGAGGRDAMSSGEGGNPGSDAGCGTCPGGSTCGHANGIPVCRASSGIPLFTNVYVILMENTSLSTLQPAMQGGTAPNLATLAAQYATGSNYHGVAHPSLPNYIALTSGSTQGIGCDCEAASGKGSCGLTNCNLVLGTCTCTTTAQSLGDQLEAAKKTWMDYGEDMATPCNVVDSGNYAVRHNPFLYYDDVQGSATRCDSHVVDFAGFNPASPADFNFIAPNLIDDMHNPDPTTSANIPDGDAWIGPHVSAITSSAAFKKGGLLVVVWDEDDDSGGLTGTDDPVPIFVISPFGKHGGYTGAAMADHYALLATIEDGLGLPRLGQAATATPLVDYFPAQ